MALIDDIEFYGRAVAAGDMPHPEAARALAEASGGVLTLVGAGIVLDDWQTARASYRQTFSGVARALAKIYGLDDIQP